MSIQTRIEPCDWCGEPSVIELLVEEGKFGTQKTNAGDRKILVQAERRRWACADHAQVEPPPAHVVVPRKPSANQLRIEV